MKVRLIGEKKVIDFALQHARTIADFNEWVYKVRSADWNSTDDIASSFHSARIQKNEVVFDIGDSGFKIVCSYQISWEISTFHLIVERVF